MRGRTRRRKSEKWHHWNKRT